jgi:hypothetical protein
MPIPNVSTLYSRIAKGSEGGGEFARFIRLLFTADYSSQGIRFISESDSSGDYKKVDAYILGGPDLPQLTSGFQFKFYPCNLSTKQKLDIEDGIQSALQENSNMQDYYLITPEDFQKEQQGWFDQLRLKYEKTYTIRTQKGFYSAHRKIHHWGHSKIIELSLKHDHIGSRYFPELFPLGIGKFKLANASMDSDVCSWAPSKHRENTFFQRNGDAKRTTDPIFDFQFKNSTAEIHLLQRIELHIEAVWTDIKGFSKKHVLRSVGTVIHKTDFSKNVNAIALNDPLIFQSNQPKRFRIQLQGFAEDCPGNYAQIKFWFYFDELTIPTNSFILDF